jgi:hypothetical protein
MLGHDPAMRYGLHHNSRGNRRALTTHMAKCATAEGLDSVFPELLIARFEARMLPFQFPDGEYTAAGHPTKVGAAEDLHSDDEVDPITDCHPAIAHGHVTIDCNRAADRVGPDRKRFWPPQVETCRSLTTSSEVHDG